jgi:hypothetical protein
LSGVWPPEAPPLYTVGLELDWRSPEPVERIVLQLLEG